MLQKIFVFDLYNTLVEITAPSMAFMKLYGMYQSYEPIANREFRRMVMTQPYEQLTQTLTENLYIDLNPIQNDLNAELASVKLFPETLEVLTQLSLHYPLYLVSNLASPYKQPVYDLGLDQFFQQMIFSCDVGYLKPQKEIFKLIPHKPDDEVMMVGDSWNADIKGAQSMGWNYWWLQRKQVNDLSKRLIQRLKDLV